MIVAVGDAAAGIRVGNLSRNYAGSYKNTSALEQQYYNSVAVEEDRPVDISLPVPVADAELAEQVKRGDANARTDMNSLNKCAQIYPEGEFIWDKPTIGRNAGGAPTCVAVVEMRAIGVNGSLEYTTVARGKLAAGDSVRCNISYFPSTTYLPDISKVVFPADNKPTREEVISVMNEEQKSKAGLKIAAAALIGGIGGNLVGKSAPNEDKLLGANPEKLKTTAAGAAAGAALMAASAYSGKVAGDVILHTGVNAAAGGVIGNMAQSGDDVLRVEKCVSQNTETTCLWGNLTTTEQLVEGQVYSNVNGSDVFVCTQNNGETTCKKQNNLVVRKVAGEIVGKYRIAGDVPADIKRYHFDARGDIEGNNGDGYYYFEAEAEKRSGLPIPAVIVGFQDGAFGTKTDTWNLWQAANKRTATICRRDSSGNPTECNLKKAAKVEGEEGVPYTVEDFTPLKVSAEDGNVIDFSNKARLGATVKGAGVGAAMGAFSGYQGAQSDIEDRLNQATREYNDSLEKFYCGTGKKFLSFYNDDAIIPTMNNK